jgi:hypothetical protein
MIKSSNIDELEYDVKSQIAAMQQIRCGLNSNGDCEMLKYFIREYCRTSDIPDSLDELKAKHGALCDEIESIEFSATRMSWMRDKTAS